MKIDLKTRYLFYKKCLSRFKRSNYESYICWELWALSHPKEKHTKNTRDEFTDVMIVYVYKNFPEFTKVFENTDKYNNCSLDDNEQRREVLKEVIKIYFKKK